MRLLATLLLVSLAVPSVQAQSGTRGGMQGSGSRGRASARSYQAAPGQQNHQVQPSFQSQEAVAAPVNGGIAGCASCGSGANVTESYAPVIVESAAPYCTKSSHSHYRQRSYGRSRRCRRRRR